MKIPIILFSLLSLFIASGCGKREGGIVGTWCADMGANEMSGCKLEETLIWRINPDHTMKQAVISERQSQSNNNTGGVLENPNKWLGNEMAYVEELKWSLNGNDLDIGNGEYRFTVSSITNGKLSLKGTDGTPLILKRCVHDEHLRMLGESR